MNQVAPRFEKLAWVLRCVYAEWWVHRCHFYQYGHQVPLLPFCSVAPSSSSYRVSSSFLFSFFALLLSEPFSPTPYRPSVLRSPRNTTSSSLLSSSSSEMRIGSRAVAKGWRRRYFLDVLFGSCGEKKGLLLSSWNEESDLER